MTRLWLSGMALAGLVACTSGVPFSNPTPPGQAQRDAALAQSPAGGFPPISPVATTPLGADPAAQPLPGSVIDAVGADASDASDAQAAADAAAANSGVPPIQASPSNPPPEAVNAAGISTEQDFDAVSSQRSIESDAAKIADNRAQYTVIQPRDLPTRPGTNTPNIVEYALRTTNPVGASLYSRSRLTSATRFARNCVAYVSPDAAQEDFLARGGPRRDRKGLDPDGDGFACGWDPTPFRAARNAAPAPVPSVVEPLVISTE